MRRAVLAIAAVALIFVLLFSFKSDDPFNVIRTDIFQFYNDSDTAGWLAFINTRHKDTRNQLVQNLNNYLSLRAKDSVDKVTELEPKLTWLLPLYTKEKEITDLTHRFDFYRNMNRDIVIDKLTLDSTIRATFQTGNKIAPDSLINLLIGYKHQYQAIADSFYVAYLEYQIGKIYYDNQNIDSAEYYLRRCERLTENIEDYGRLGQCNLLLAKIYNIYRADYCRSEKAYQRALQCYKKIDEQDGILYATLGRGYDLMQLSDNETAIRQFNMALDGYIKRNKSSGAAYCRHCLAELYYNTGAYDRAICYIDTALNQRKEIARENPGKVDKIVDVGHSESTAGLIYQALGQKSKAREMYLAAERSFELSPKKDGRCINSLHMASLSLEENNIEHARQLYYQALQINEKGEKYEELLYSMYGLAVCQYYEKQVDEAAGNLKQCIRLVEDSRRRLPIPDMKAGLLSDKIGFYNLLVNIFLEKYIQSSSVKYMDSALFYIEKSKAATFKELLSSEEKSKISPEEDSLLQEMSLIYRKVTLGEIYHIDAENEITRLEDQLRQIRFGQAVEIAAADKPFTGDISILSIQNNLLSENDILIEYILSRFGSYILSVGHDFFSLSKMEIDYDSLSNRISNLIHSINKYPDKPDDTIRFKKDAEFLYGKLIPENIINNQSPEHLIFVISGPLHYLPLGVLIDKNHTFLAEKYDISYAPSAGALKIIKNRRKVDSKFDCILALGDPEFNPDSITLNKSRNDQSTRDIQFFDAGSVAALPYSRIEIDSIRSIFGKERTIAYVGIEASEFQFKSADFKRIKYIHLASHGISDIHNPSRSAILLSCRDDMDNDGLLHPDEIRQLDFSADLVFLSACRTGAGRLLPGEGVMSLARPFLISGCRSAVVTSWNINDRSSAEFVSYFYKYINQDYPKAKALAMAKKKFIQSRRKLYRHPYFWAPYILIGLNN